MATIRKRTWVTPAGEPRQAWVADFKDGQGRRRQLQFARRRDADAELLKARTAVHAGTFTADRESATIEQAFDLWIEGAEAEDLERGTVESYKLHRRHALAAIDGQTRLSKLTAPMVEELRDTLLRQHNRATAAKVLGAFRRVIRNARRLGLVSQDVASSTTIGTAKRHRRRLKAGRDFPTPAEVKALLDAADDPRAKAFLVLAALAGLRGGEIRGLAWSSVDLGKSPSVEVVQRADRWGVLGPPKSGAGQRKVPLGEIAVRALKAWRLAQPPGRKLLFETSGKRPDQLTNLKAALLDPLAIEAGLKCYGVHSFRHYAVSSWLLTCQGNLKAVQVRAGHSDLSVTLNTYSHLLPDSGEHGRIADAEAALRR